MREPSVSSRARPRAVPQMNDVPVYENWTEGSRDLTAAIEAHTAMLAETNKSLVILADCAGTTLHFFKKWIPIFIGAAGILWPVARQVIDAVAQAAGVAQ